jgi:hypothetical protein
LPYSLTMPTESTKSRDRMPLTGLVRAVDSARCAV